MRFRYTGPLPVTFPTIGVEVEPGDEFEVPDLAAPGFAARADLEALPDPKPPRARRAAKADDTDPTGTEPTPTVTQEVCAISDDH